MYYSLLAHYNGQLVASYDMFVDEDGHTIFGMEYLTDICNYLNINYMETKLLEWINQNNFRFFENQKVELVFFNDGYEFFFKLRN
jgi:hypothetical protein